ncbi:hypothetical protein KCU71_g4174, partial [Aureobasidium melanogenum]
MSPGSSSSSSSSFEPAPKRLKSHDLEGDYSYGQVLQYPLLKLCSDSRKPDVVLLGVRRLEANISHHPSNVVACVHSTCFDHIARALHPWDEAPVRKDDFLRVRHIEFDQKPRFVRFIAHYAQERDTAAAINSTLPNDGAWSDHFCKIFGGARLEDGFINEVQDSLIDHLLGWIRKRKHDGNWVRNTLRSIIEAADYVDACLGGSPLNGSSHFIKLLAVLALHHARDLFECHNSHDGLEEFDDFTSRVRECAFAELLKAFPHGNFTTIPKDPLEEEFDEHCVYHIHGEDEPCYRSALGCFTPSTAVRFPPSATSLRISSDTFSAA